MNNKAFEEWVKTTGIATEKLVSGITSVDYIYYQAAFEAGQRRGMEELLINNTDVLTINILRLWSREKIVKFAEHLLGEEISHD